MDECLYCKGQLEEKRVSRVQEYHGRWYLIENVPALVCRQCGETFYTPQAHSLVLRLVRESAEPVRTEQMAVLDAS
ncbi:MAG: YgiT-type zinc finger protein [Chloroflexi bacterium]|nr:YgiT-type zinc finger protein [Chloroflexota bacterium]